MIFFLDVMIILMVIRAVLSWLPIDENGAFINFIYGTTETIILPVRMLLERFERLNAFPIDIAFLISFVILYLIQAILMAF